MKKYLYAATLIGLFTFCGCGIVNELGPAIKEGIEEAGPPPIDFGVVGSYILNAALLTWGAYERRQRQKGRAK